MPEADRKTESRIAVDVTDRPRLSLLVMGERGVSTHPLPQSGAITIGRAEHCDVVIADAQLSRQHARLHFDRVVPSLEDLGSSNGTRVGSDEITKGERIELRLGDVVSMGCTVLMLQRAHVEERERPDAMAEAPTSPELAPGGSLTSLRAIAERFAVGTIPVLVLGETGVGKDVLSAMIHQLSPRSACPYVCINCAALPEALLESELFGYERGAFTGATTAKAGLLESARGGTVLLDEVGEMPPAAQAKLLRVLDQGEVLRLGSTRPRPIDVRFIAATNRDLEIEVERGRFREDLYFRLAAAAIVVPPLRERVAEIGPLARTFVKQACRHLGRARVPKITTDALAVLEKHTWPGNIRELRNAMERAVLLAVDGDIGVAHLAHEKMGRKIRAPQSERRRNSEPPRSERPPASTSGGPMLDRARSPSAPPPSTRGPSFAPTITALGPPPSFPPQSFPPPSSGTQVAPSARSTAPPLHVSARVTDSLARDPEAAKLLAVLDACDWNQTKAAKELGVSRRTLVSRLSAYGLTRKRSRD